MLISWLAFPLVLALLGLGWGLLVDLVSGAELDRLLVIPLGLAAAIVAGGLTTTSPTLSRATVPVAVAGALAGLALGWRRRRRAPGPGARARGDWAWPALAAVVVLLAYGAPVILSGEATFAGYVRLDDTATWLGAIDRVITHGRSLSGLAPSTYQLTLSTYLVAGGYPTGAFMLPGIGRALVGADAAWIFQPYLACCGAAVALVVAALAWPFVAAPRPRAVVAFVAAQPALLYGYSLWGGVKELTAAFELILLVALLAPLIGIRPSSWRRLLAPAVAGAALMVTLGPGGAIWVAPAMGLVVISWFWAARHPLRYRGPAVSTLVLGFVTVVLAVPVLLELSSFLGTDSALFASGGGGAAAAIGLGNLIHPLSVFQLAGVWPVGDFRYAPGRFPTALLIWLVGVTAAAGIWWGARRRRLGLPLYVGLALLGCALTALSGASPWVIGKSLAIGSPAVLACGLAFTAAMSRSARGWLAVFAVIAVGVIWSNVLAYHDVLLAPRARLAELAQIDARLAGAQPTLLNEYEIYGDRHFLRDGAPQEPAEYRPSLIPLSDGALLTKSAWADLDSFPTATLSAFRSIVTRRSPADSRPPSIYSLRWAGRYYELWQRPAAPAVRVVIHDALGDSVGDPWCGQSTGTGSRARCSIQPVAVPACRRVVALASIAASMGGSLVAAPREPAVVARATQAALPAGWTRDPAAGSVAPTGPGTLRMSLAVPRAGRYEAWLGGSFSRGFEVSVDGRRIGRVEEQLAMIGQWSSVGTITLGSGPHVVSVSFPHADLTPGSGDVRQNLLTGIALAPVQSPDPPLLRVPAAQARQLCGRPLDWIEVVVPAAR